MKKIKKLEKDLEDAYETINIFATDIILKVLIYMVITKILKINMILKRY